MEDAIECSEFRGTGLNDLGRARLASRPTLGWLEHREETWPSPWSCQHSRTRMPHCMLLTGSATLITLVIMRKPSSRSTYASTYGPSSAKAGLRLCTTTLKVYTVPSPLDTCQVVSSEPQAVQWRRG